MRRSAILLCTVISIVCLTTSVPAAWHSWWTDNGADHLWSNGANWGGSGVPTATLNAEVSYVSTSGKAGPILDVAGALTNFKIEDGYIKITNGGALAVGGYMAVGGYGGVEKGMLEMSGNAALSVVGQFWVGDYTDGHLIVKDNSQLDLYNLKLGYDGAVGTVELQGGATECGWLVINPGSSIDITGGSLQINREYATLQEVQDWKDSVDAMVLDNRIFTSYAGGSVCVGHTQFSWDEEEQKYMGSTCITAVPEPATIALLGLGALSLIRRKK